MFPWQFIKILGCPLYMPHIKKCFQSQSLQNHMLDAIKSVIAYSGNEDDDMANDEVSVDQASKMSPIHGRFAECLR